MAARGNELGCASNLLCTAICACVDEGQSFEVLLKRSLTAFHMELDGFHRKPAGTSSKNTKQGSGICHLPSPGCEHRSSLNRDIYLPLLSPAQPLNNHRPTAHTHSTLGCSQLLTFVGREYDQYTQWCFGKLIITVVMTFQHAHFHQCSSIHAAQGWNLPAQPRQPSTLHTLQPHSVNGLLHPGHSVKILRHHVSQPVWRRQLRKLLNRRLHPNDLSRFVRTGAEAQFPIELDELLRAIIHCLQFQGLLSKEIEDGYGESQQCLCHCTFLWWWATRLTFHNNSPRVTCSDAASCSNALMHRSRVASAQPMDSRQCTSTT
mmetsp:Transcript_22912/g.52507  ORF Transcript_22912/g.52507 Transcript_22912/m.52507 type:complete len:319 (-) Transcript_22912:205-1161(-)